MKCQCDCNCEDEGNLSGADSFGLTHLNITVINKTNKTVSFTGVGDNLSNSFGVSPGQTSSKKMSSSQLIFEVEWEKKYPNQIGAQGMLGFGPAGVLIEMGGIWNPKTKQGIYAKGTVNGEEFINYGALPQQPHGGIWYSKKGNQHYEVTMTIEGLL